MTPQHVYTTARVVDAAYRIAYTGILFVYLFSGVRKRVRRRRYELSRQTQRPQ